MMDTSPKDTIAALRNDIDQIDDQLLALLDRRAALAHRIGRLKQDCQASGPDKREPAREEAILARLDGANKGPLPKSAVASIFNMIFAACLSLQYGDGKNDPTCDILDH